MKIIQYDAEKTTQGSAEYFTGKVTIHSHFVSEGAGSYSGAMVNFEAGARTAWHTHPLGQTLIVISGEGLVQKQGESIQKIRHGDTIWIPANVKHWHGAVSDGIMSHIAIAGLLDGKTVDWLEHVSDAQYSHNDA